MKKATRNLPTLSPPWRCSRAKSSTHLHRHLKVFTTSPLEEPAVKPNKGKETPARTATKIPQTGPTKAPVCSPHRNSLDQMYLTLLQRSLIRTRHSNLTIPLLNGERTNHSTDSYEQPLQMFTPTEQTRNQCLQLENHTHKTEPGYYQYKQNVN